MGGAIEARNLLMIMVMLMMIIKGRSAPENLIVLLLGVVSLLSVCCLKIIFVN